MWNKGPRKASETSTSAFNTFDNFNDFDTDATGVWW